jgi:hypothetical protein
LVGLEVVPRSVPRGLVTHFSIVQPGHKNKNLRVRHSLAHSLNAAKGLPLEGLQVGEGKKCLPLCEWMQRHYDIKILDNVDAELVSNT